MRAAHIREQQLASFIITLPEGDNMKTSAPAAVVALLILCLLHGYCVGADSSK